MVLTRLESPSDVGHPGIQWHDQVGQHHVPMNTMSQEDENIKLRYKRRECYEYVPPIAQTKT